jgi:hypothetical protein
VEVTLKEVRRRVAEIEAMKDDDEAAHILEASLHGDVLACIANSTNLAGVRDLAREALKTKDIEFERWFA